MRQINLPYGKHTLPVAIPDRWLGQIAVPEPVLPASDPEALVREAIQRPIESPPLAHLVKPGQSVAIIVDDYTRKTPASRLLPPILTEILSTGIRQEDIRIVVAHGTHRRMTQSELNAKIGSKIMDQYEIVNTPCDAQDEMLYLGTSSNGIPAWVNRTVAEAEVRIGLGTITPHSDAGFSGGAKIILPGVCNSITVNTFHAVGAFLGETQLGRIDSPLRQDLEQFVAEQVPLTFIINAVLTLGGQIFQCVAGHPVAAHRQGVLYAKEVFGVPIPRRFEVAVANCYPYDIDLWQSTKGAFCGSLATADGGTLIWVTAASEGNSNYPRFPFFLGRDRQEMKHEIEAGKLDHAALAAESIKLGMLRKRLNLILVSQGINQADADRMAIHRYPTIEAALDNAVPRLPASRREGSICVIPQAGVVLPIVEAS